MVVREDPDAERWGAVELDGEQRIIRINGRGGIGGDSLRQRMFAGVHIVHPHLLRTVPSGRESSIIDAYVHEIQSGERVLSYPWPATGRMSGRPPVMRPHNRRLMKDYSVLQTEND